MPKPKPKTTKTKPKTKAKPKPKPKRTQALPIGDSYRDASRMVDMCGTSESGDLLKRGKGVVPIERLMGTWFFAPMEVWGGMRVPTEPTAEVCNIISYLVRNGMTVDAAARAVGVTNPEFLSWVDRGVKDIQAGQKNTPCALFVRMADMADAQDEMASIIAIGSGAANWQGRAWIQERKHKQRWGKLGGVSAIVNITEAPKTQSVDALIPEAAEVLLYLEEAGYTAPSKDTEE